MWTAHIGWGGATADDYRAATCRGGGRCLSGRKAGNYRKNEKPSNLLMSSSPSKCFGMGEYLPGETGVRLDLYSREPLLPAGEI